MNRPCLRHPECTPKWRARVCGFGGRDRADAGDVARATADPDTALDTRGIPWRNRLSWARGRGHVNRTDTG
jgi:hypothetical protein